MAKLTKPSIRANFLILACIFLAGFSLGYLSTNDDHIKANMVDANLENVEVCFSPEGRCEQLAIRAIDSAKQEILVRSYSFTSKGIGQALIDAHARGIKVAILFDKSQLTANYSQIPRLKKAGIPAKVDVVQGIAHNKCIIIDGERLITGSYNFSNAANKRNAENMLYIKDKKLTQIYRKKWLERNS